jgi:pilus assembly protein CpaB
MKPARLAVLAIAILAGAAAIYTLSDSEPPPPTVVRAPGPAMSEVLVAANDLPVGRSIKSADLRWQAWPADAVPAGLLRRTENPNVADEIANSIPRFSFLAGEPIRREKLIKADGSGFMSAILPSGMRAVAISIDTRGATSAGGFVLPNDRVDLIRTYREEDAGKAGGADAYRTETILPNVRVLAIGQTIQERNGEKVVTGETATLELSPAQAELVTLAQKTGQLSLALRSLADANQPEAVRDERPDATLTVVRYGVSRQAPRQ